jgi:hypothetical protein
LSGSKLIYPFVSLLCPLVFPSSLALATSHVPYEEYHDGEYWIHLHEGSIPLESLKGKYSVELLDFLGKCFISNPESRRQPQELLVRFTHSTPILKKLKISSDDTLEQLVLTIF